MIARYFKFTTFLAKLDFLPLLAIRLIIAYGMYGPAMKKVEHFDGIVNWFTKMGLPAPTLNAYLATTTEVLALILLPLGLGIRFISVPLMITMLVAIKTVHWENGFKAAQNGFEIPLYYFIMLFVLFIYGSGKAGADYWIAKAINRKK